MKPSSTSIDETPIPSSTDGMSGSTGTTLWPILGFTMTGSNLPNPALASVDEARTGSFKYVCHSGDILFSYSALEQTETAKQTNSTRLFLHVAHAFSQQICTSAPLGQTIELDKLVFLSGAYF
ncbi:hypothetical protein RvY_08227-2 [Ramazzottius varieornatus]|uniref:Uncharacterized protein n=1 Tax=Ramazzottius varieornatus TaxID=947166 RepID=A0A1D1V7G2_RAMVA|nr:hypothetical protein RvY_08227-2 [Ramazzottius varieornatus]